MAYLLADPDLGDTEAERRALLNQGGLTIKTTIDLRMQRAADKSVRSHVFPTDRAIGGLAMVEPGTGQVRALAQSRPMGSNAGKGQTYLDYVVPPEYGDSNGFQAGSTFKAFVLTAAIAEGIPLSTQITAPQTIKLPVNRFRGCDGRLKSTDYWSPENSTGAGTFDLYSGTQLSVNTFFAQLELRTGLCKPARLAREMGVAVPSPVFPSFTLGVSDTNPLSMAEAYATFAARGVHCDTRPVTEIRDSNGKLVAGFPDKCSRLVDRPVADAVNDVLRGVQEGTGFGASAGLALQQPSAGKTGTTNNNRAVWFIGYTPNMAAAAMIAGANRKGQWRTLNGQTVGGVYISGAHGSTNAGPIWGDAMKVVEQFLPDKGFHAPDPRTIEGQSAVVPSLYGYDPQEAAQILRQNGFNPVIGPTVDSANTIGAVAYLSPGSGSSAQTGTTVTIYLSDGSPYVAPQPSPAAAPSQGTESRDTGGVQNAATSRSTNRGDGGGTSTGVGNSHKTRSGTSHKTGGGTSHKTGGGTRHKTGGGTSTGGGSSHKSGGGNGHRSRGGNDHGDGNDQGGGHDNGQGGGNGHGHGGGHSHGGHSHSGGGRHSHGGHGHRSGGGHGHGGGHDTGGASGRG